MQISDTITWLNSNTGAVQAIATVILVLITAYYAVQAKRNVQVLEKTEEEARRPSVAIHIEQREDWLNFINLVIGNYGNGIARNITFKTKNNLTLFRQEEELKNLSIIKNGLPALVPQQIIRIPLLSLIGRIDDLKKEDIEICFEYKNHSLERSYSDKFIISFNSLIDRQIGNPPMYEIAKNTEGIKKSIEKIAYSIERRK
jgi:hypothetical protein